MLAGGDEPPRLPEAAPELCGLVSSVYRRVEREIRHHALVLWGGLLENNTWLRTEVTNLLRRSHPRIVVQEPLGSATLGACMLAADLAK